MGNSCELFLPRDLLMGEGYSVPGNPGTCRITLAISFALVPQYPALALVQIVLLYELDNSTLTFRKDFRMDF